MHILLNFDGGENENVQLGSVLENFKSFSQDLPADMRGLCLSNSLEIRQIHNEFGNIEEILAFGEEDEDIGKDNKEKSKDPFHFVSFISKNGQIYELDGLRDAPLVHFVEEEMEMEMAEDGKGNCSSNSSSLSENKESENKKSEWTTKVLEIIKKRTRGNTEIRFNLMAVVVDRRERLRAEIAELNVKIDNDNPSKVKESGAANEKTTWLTQRFKAQQELDDEEAKWSRHRKDWVERQNRHRDMQPKLDDNATNPVKLSAQVQDLLKSMTSKGLLPK